MGKILKTKLMDAIQLQAITTIKEMITRNFGESVVDIFDLYLDNTKSDYFSLKASRGIVRVKADKGVNLAYGVYYYIKNYLGFMLSHNLKVQKELKVSDFKVIDVQVEKNCLARYRYAYNYCTHSYTMAFWGESEWQKELDWLAFHGVNLVLDITGEEGVWYEFFKRIGYSDAQAQAILVGPAYQAWFCMANMYAYGGGLNPEYIADRVALARRNRSFMASLGIDTVRLGYCGMVPEDIKAIDPKIKIIKQGKWNEFLRPAMLKPNSQGYKKYAEMFYAVQKEVLGEDVRFFSTDPFHEGGRRGLTTEKSVATAIFDAMQKVNKDCIWVVQAWGGNPTKGFLKALKNKKQQLLILDLYAEKLPRFKQGEFLETPWIYCMLNIFGGRAGLAGHLDNMQKDIPIALRQTKCNQGVGIAPEALNVNDLLDEYLFDSVWEGVADDFDAWLKKYIKARYGQDNEDAYACYKILCETVFCATYNAIGEGAPESVVCARPSLYVKKASSWGNTVISYDKNRLLEALRLLTAAGTALNFGEEYSFDVVDIKKQVLANKAQDLLAAMALAYEKADAEEFESLSQKFLDNIKETDSVLEEAPIYSLATWLDMAKAISSKYDSSVQANFRKNARCLITTWGDRENCEKGGLHDYSARQWSGLMHLYLKRWSLFCECRLAELRGLPGPKEDYFEIEEEWVNE